MSIQIENLIEERRRYINIIGALLDDFENKRNIVPRDETIYLFPMMNLWKNEKIVKWLFKSRNGGLCEKHILQIIGWMYDHLILLNGVSKRDIAKCLLESGALMDYKNIESIRVNLSQKTPKYIDALLKEGVTQNALKC